VKGHTEITEITDFIKSRRFSYLKVKSVALHCSATLRSLVEEMAEMTEMAETGLVDRLRELIENEARSCSMDFGCITPLYVYRMLGGSVCKPSF